MEGANRKLSRDAGTEKCLEVGAALANGYGGVLCVGENIYFFRPMDSSTREIP